MKKENPSNQQNNPKTLNKPTQPNSVATSLSKFSLHLYFEDIFALKEIILM